MSATERETQREAEGVGKREKIRAITAKTLPKATYLHLSIIGFSVSCDVIIGLLEGKGYERFNIFKK